AARLDDLEKRVDLLVTAHDLELHDREVPVAVDETCGVRLEPVRLVAIANRMNLDHRDARRAGGLQLLHDLVDLIAANVGLDLFHDSSSVRPRSRRTARHDAPRRVRPRPPRAIGPFETTTEARGNAGSSCAF